MGGLNDCVGWLLKMRTEIYSCGSPGIAGADGGMNAVWKHWHVSRTSSPLHHCPLGIL